MDNIEKEFMYGGRKCVITFTEFGYWCGYAEIRPNEKLYNKNFVEINDERVLPFRISYAGTTFPIKDGTFWIGFTCDDKGEKPDSARVKEIWGDQAFVMIYLNMQKVSPFPKNGILRDINYVENKLKRLVNGVDVYENGRQNT